MKTYVKHYPAKYNQGLESWGIYIPKHSSYAMIYANNLYSIEYIAYFYIKNCNLFSEGPIGLFTAKSKAVKRVAFKHFKKLLTSLAESYEKTIDEIKKKE